MTSKRLPYRGGNWNNGSNAGLAALNCNNSRVNTNNNIGFRLALEQRQKLTVKALSSSASSKGCRVLWLSPKHLTVTPMRCRHEPKLCIRK